MKKIACENELLSDVSIDLPQARRILVCAPHPDDEIFGCAGILTLFREKNAEITVLIVTDGAAGGPNADGGLPAIREAESRAAAKVLGLAEPIFWQYPDRSLIYGEHLIEQLLEIITRLDADLVLLPSPTELHPDHQVLAFAGAEALRRLGGKRLAAFYEINAPLQSPNLCLDISRVVDKKLEAMRCFPSQLQEQPYDIRIEGLNRFRSYFLGPQAASAEAFTLIDGIHLGTGFSALFSGPLLNRQRLGFAADICDIPLVSIIVRSMNRPSLSRALDSIALQTYPNIEVVVVNASGGAHDNMPEFCGHFPLRLINHNGEALPRARAANCGLTESLGTYLSFLDDDDTIDPDHIQCLLEEIQNVEEQSVAYTGVRSLNCLDSCEKPTLFAEAGIRFPRLLLGNIIPIHAVLFPSSLVKEGVRFDETLDLYEDWDFWLQIARMVPFRFSGRISATYYQGGESGVSPLDVHKTTAEQAAARIYQKWVGSLKPHELLEMGILYLQAVSQETSLKNAAIDKDSTIEALNHAIADQNQTIADQNQTIADQNRVNKLCSVQIAELQATITHRNNQIAALATERAAMFATVSWKVTKPLRFCRRVLAKSARLIWRFMPLSFIAKQQLKGFLFEYAPLVFSKCNAYRNWLISRDERPDSLPEICKLPAVHLEPLAEPVYVPLLEATPPKHLPIRLIAFYLPQFHAIPENNTWWGEGFTEWTNVRPAQPLFEGHYQPHVPGELGYYNLLDPEIQRRQIELAKLYGIGGFCFYFYWFGGKRLLEAPIENYLENRALDLPFCLCWANENWSRRWDGLDKEILIAQQYSAEDDLAFISHIAKYLRDDRYIRINGRPLLIVYWVAQLPAPKETARRWRNWCRDNGIGELYLACTQSFDKAHPATYGFDAAIEFPPNNATPPDITQWVKPVDGASGYTVYDWRFYVERSRNYKKAKYTLFRSVCPSWDNTARRKSKGTIFLNSSPRSYQQWLTNAIRETCDRFNNVEERLVFVNAWNEWAEGAHLEPDQRFGYAWLDATRKALEGATESSTHKLIVVSHDAHPHGAQFLALGMVRSLTQDLGLEVAVVLLGPGKLHKKFSALATVYDLSQQSADYDATVKLSCDLVRKGFRHAVVNTTVAGAVIPVFQQNGIESICLVHELPGVISSYGLQEHTLKIAASASKIVFPAKAVADGFARFAELKSEQAVIRPQGLYRRNPWRYNKAAAKVELCRQLELAPEMKIVLAVGYADHRKGVDLFVESAFAVLGHRTDVCFIWVGHWEQSMQPTIEMALLESSYRNHIRFVGFDAETARYHAAADVYALTSREDPFPNVVLESFDTGVPVVAFGGTGGGSQLVEQLGGLVVPPENPVRFGEAICRLLDDPELAQSLGHAGQVYVDSHMAFRAYLFDICRLSGLLLPRISVVVPNYNYARHICQRLDSIRVQTMPFYELIILDDTSTDNSLSAIQDWLVASGVEARVIVNQKNSGNVFAQWKRGIETATGDYLWIAEADDLSSPDFLETVVPSLLTGNTVLSYCESKQIDADGRVVAENYHDYLAPVFAERWKNSYSSVGLDEIDTCLAVMNTIPNVSGVVFRREALSAVFTQYFDEILSFRKAGDWLVYLRLLADGDVAFSPRAANLHRRHEHSVIAAGSARQLCDEIASVQQLAAREYSLSANTRTRAEQYLAKIKSQFGIS